MCDTQHLEIVHLEQDVPVQANEVGRLLFTSRARQGQDVRRYDVGDSGRWVPGPCPCGLDSPRFELLQRHGKLLRVGTEFISPLALQERVGRPIQMLLDHAPNGMERLLVLASSESGNVRQSLLTDEALANAVNNCFLMVEIHECTESDFKRNTHSGKTPLVIDHRIKTDC